MTTQNKPLPARPAPPPDVCWILFTGASGGMGQATVARLADAGHVVFAAARRAGELLQAAATVDGIAATLAGAALARRPRPRYRPGLRNRLNTRLTTLPTGSSDRIKRRIAGLAPSAPPAAAGPDGATPPSRAAAPPTRASTRRGHTSAPLR